MDYFVQYLGKDRLWYTWFETDARWQAESMMSNYKQRHPDMNWRIKRNYDRSCPYREC